MSRLDDTSRAGAARLSRSALPVLRGLAQVDFMPNAATGVLFLAALCAAGPEFAAAGLLGAAVGTGTACALGVDRQRIASGLEGFNGCLVGVDAVVYLGAGHVSTWVLAAGGAVVVAVVTGALARVLDTWRLPTLTLPFCLVGAAMMIGAPGFRRVWHGGEGPALPRPATGDTALSFGDLWHAFFSNIGQIFLVPQWYAGVLFLIGIFVASRVAGLLACLGSVVGIVTAWGLGAPAADVAQGLTGYNAVLVSMALGCVFLSLSRWAVAYACVAAASTTALTAAATNFFAPVGGHTLTWPFVVTALLFLAAADNFPRLQRA